MRRASSPPAIVLAVVGVLAVLALLSGCAVGPSVRPPVATRDDSAASGSPQAEDDLPPPPLLPPLIAAPTAAVSFVDCAPPGGVTDGDPEDAAVRDLHFACGRVPVSGRGEAGSAAIGVLRVTRGPAPPSAVPIAVVGEANGPSGADEAVRLADQAPDAILSGTALYGIDLRGTGASDPIDCVTQSRREAMTDADPTAADPVGLAPLGAAAGTASRTCAQVLENGLTDYRTDVGAEDIDQVRTALGVSRLHAIGVGEGAGVLSAWASRHPESAGRLVLDGLPGPSTSSSVTASERTTAARAALTAFATDCTARPGCPLGPDPVRAVSDILAGLHTTPLTGPDGRSVTDGTATTALVAGLEQPSRWTTTATALAQARTGDPNGLLALIAPIEGTRDSDGTGLGGGVGAGAGAGVGGDGSFDPGLAMTCNDTGERLTADQVAQQAARARGTDPVFGAFFAQQALRCAAWPVPPTPDQQPPGSAPSPLVLGTTGDPATPLTGTQRAVATMPSATLLTWLGAGHGAYPATPCVTDAVGAYLLGGTIPRAGTVCPP